MPTAIIELLELPYDCFSLRSRSDNNDYFGKRDWLVFKPDRQTRAGAMVACITPPPLSFMRLINRPIAS